MAPHDLVLVVGLVALAVTQVLIHRSTHRRSGVRVRTPDLPVTPRQPHDFDSAPALWPRA